MTAPAVTPVVPKLDLEQRKTMHMTRVWLWLLRLSPQPCGNCASELAMLAVEREIVGNKEYQLVDRRCRRPSPGGTSCIDRVRDIWKDRPREPKDGGP